MLLSAPEDSEKRTTTVCSCYAPIKRQHSKSCEGSESKRVIAPMKGHANGQGPPADPNLPPPPPPPLPPPLKSNLKKPTTVGEQQMMMVRDERRKVSWPDAHGRDLAHVQVFHSRFKCCCLHHLTVRVDGGINLPIVLHDLLNFIFLEVRIAVRSSVCGWFARKDWNSVVMLSSRRKIARFNKNIVKFNKRLEMEAELCSVHTLSPSQGESGDEELSVLPRHTKVIVTGNNRTKSVLVGLQGVVKKAVGLGGWHWLVLKNGEEVKLQRNALSVLEAPTGNEDDEIDCDTSFCSSSDMGEKDMDYTGSEFHKPRKSRIRHTRSWKSNGQSNIKDIHSHGFKPRTRVRLSKLETATLWRYWKHFNLVSSNPSPTKEQLVHDVQHHFLSQKLDETEVILGFIHAAKRLRILYS
ncbi:unnamed protein product [Musa textilis]